MKITKIKLMNLIKEEIKKMIDPDIEVIKRLINQTWQFTRGNYEDDYNVEGLIRSEDIIAATEAVNNLNYKLAELSDIKKGDLVCPYCETKLTQSRFNGYYSRFDFWECGCDKLPNIENELGDHF